ncbi:PREDICTED: general odorant-binding protein 56h-like [Bactrocera latifrons]|uniref:general odorant-binding protein 56h-like n=1 Tax=Bactrocera latifrons TaxID=174628 RepID=UPI0008DD3CD6|nr:PREDICTED: general odorant-binding protein 56h-like [Bactrocera latifrons]
MMKDIFILMILAALYSIVVCKEMIADEKYELACLIEAHVTEADLKKFLSNGLKANEANANIKCMEKCIMEKREIIKKGVFDPEKAYAEIIRMPELKGQEDHIKEAINVCKTEKGANDCDTAFKIAMCLEEFKSRNA